VIEILEKMFCFVLSLSIYHKKVTLSLYFGRIRNCHSH